MIVAIGHSEDLDSADAIEEALDACAERLGDRTPQAGLLFAGLDHDHQALLDGVQARHPGLQLIGCTTHGELSSEGFAEDSVALMLFHGAADIRASTRHRNEAVRHDALARLGRARDALAAIHQALPLTILDELCLRVRKRIEQYGVEHTMYIGPSIAPDRPFDLAYVENLRLRQLIAACAVAREVRRLGETLPMPLAIAQLVVVQHDPITLRFRADEKRFDVDSPSGVRFELLKKRLDKACVKGTEERITQPDQIAVVYSTEPEAAEYRRYAEYLAAQGDIEPEFERLDVEDLPDAAGLKMLRLKVSSSAA